MANQLFESVLSASSDLSVVYELVNELRGDDQTKYDLSWTKVQSNSEVCAVLSVLADSVANVEGGWNSGLRDNTDSAVRIRVIYELAMVIEPLAEYLKKSATDGVLPLKAAAKIFQRIIQSQHEVGYTNPYKQIGEKYSRAVIETINVCVPTRKNSSLDADYSGSDKQIQLFNKVSAKIQKIEYTVRTVLKVAGIEDKVSKDEISNAAWLLFACNTIPRDIYGKDYAGKNGNRNWNNPNHWSTEDGSRVLELYNIIDNAWGTRGSIDTELSDDDGDNGIFDETDTVSNKKTRGNYIEKDMSTIGDNTDQLNVMNRRTGVTCCEYYKLFSINFATKVPFQSAQNKLIYRLLYIMLNSLGMQFYANPVDEESAADFANEFCSFIADISTNTSRAVSVHTQCMELIEKYKKIANRPKLADTKMVHPDYANLVGALTRRIPDLQVNSKLIVDALGSIKSSIIYGGDSSVSGKIVDGDEIHAVFLPSAVASFSTDSTNDRKKLEGLTEAGNATANLFEYDDSTKMLNVRYDDTITGNSSDVDSIPLKDIRHYATNYVSSQLVPVRTGNNPSWVILHGIKAYSYMKNGNMEDSQERSTLSQKMLDLDTMANVVKDSKLSNRQTAIMMLSKPKNIQKMAALHFIPDDATLKYRIMLANNIYQRSVDTNLNDVVTKVRNLCSNFTSVVTKFAKNADGTYQTTVDLVYKKAPSLIRLVSGKTFAVNGFIASLVNEVEPNPAAYIVNNLGNAISKYKDLVAYRDKNLPMVLLTLMKNYVMAMDRLVRYAMNNAQTQTAAIVSKMYNVSGKYNEYHKLSQKIKDLYDKLSTASPEVKGNAKNVQTINETCNVLIDGRDSYIEQLDVEANRLSNDMLNSPTMAPYKAFKQSLVELVESSPVTVHDVGNVMKAIAESMDGEYADNIKLLKGLHINQFDQYVRVLKLLLTTGDGLNNDQSNVDIDVDNIDDIQSGGGQPFAEITAMHPQNDLNARLKTMRQHEANLNADIDDVSKVESTQNLYMLIQMYSKYQTAAKVFEEASSDLDDYVEDAQKLPDIPMESMSWDVDEWVKFYCNHVNTNLGFRKHAAQCLDKQQHAQEQYDEAYDEITGYLDNNPQYNGLIYALMNTEITLDQVTTALKEYEMANHQLSQLKKYATRNDAENSASETAQKRTFAYTESDNSVIAQIVYVLMGYVSNPAEMPYDDLVAILNNIRNTIDKFSQNPVSLKLVNHAIDVVQSDSDEELDEEQVVANIIKLVNELGVKFLSRGNSDADTPALAGINGIGKPESPSAQYGKAIDSFARSLLRGQKKTNTKEYSAAGKTDNAEAEAREAYLPYVINDLSENLELSKYAYMLGKAFETFDRILRDERVSASALETRVFNSTKSSLKGSMLFATGLCSNDLQRELISALIDDERNGDTTYPTLAKVYTLAKTGGTVNAYSLMHSSNIENETLITNDVRNVPVVFNGKGNKAPTPKNGAAPIATPLDAVTISSLVFGDNSHIYTMESIEQLAHDLRMLVFNKLVNKYGAVDELGDINFTAEYKDTATELLAEAIKSLYRLCDGMKTPISSIITVSTSLGQRAGRLNVMQHVSNSLKKEIDLDYDTMSMIAGEPNAYPQRISNEANRADLDWVDQFTDIIAHIPDTLSVNDVLYCVEQYCTNESSQQMLMKNPSYAVMVKLIDEILQIDTATGIPNGIWGNDSSRRKSNIRKVFNVVCSYMSDGRMTWKQCAADMKQQFMDDLEDGESLLSLCGIVPSEATRRRIGHLRMNPYYAVSEPIDANSLREVEEELVNDGIITHMGPSVRLKYPGMTFDSKTFQYIVKMTLDIQKILTKYDTTTAFTTALMCYVTGVRFNDYMKLLEKISDAQPINSDIVRDIFDEFEVKHYDEMYHTSLGWFTAHTFYCLCVYAVNEPKDRLARFKMAVDALTGGMTTRKYNQMVSNAEAKMSGISAQDNEMLELARQAIIETYNVVIHDGLVKCSLGYMTERMFNALCYHSMPSQHKADRDKFIATVIKQFRLLYKDVANGQRVSYDVASDDDDNTTTDTESNGAKSDIKGAGSKSILSRPKPKGNDDTADDVNVQDINVQSNSDDASDDDTSELMMDWFAQEEY